MEKRNTADKVNEEAPAYEDDVVILRFNRAPTGRKLKEPVVKGRYPQSRYVEAARAAADARVFTKVEGDWVTAGFRRSQYEEGKNVRLVLEPDPKKKSGTRRQRNGQK
ncbi:MAG: hypothetical protein IT368_13225 [Candidatus Hydrogenedentes bacterium]|nr:hypothetical protein [Candidatus Hydrogenedentota bacterium]